ncbi:MAG: hypothetical protein WHS77_08515 [Brevinematales bacterium]
MKNFLLFALAFVMVASCSLSNEVGKGGLETETSEIGGVASLTIELDVGQGDASTKSVISVEEFDVVGATIALSNSYGEGEVKTWKAGDSFVFTFQAKRTGMHTITVTDWDNGGNTNVATATINMKNGKNYRIKVRLGGVIYIQTVKEEEEEEEKISFNFDDGNKNGWVESRRYWSITNGLYCLDGDYVNFYVDRDGYSVYGAGDDKLKNYVFKVDVKGLSDLKHPILLFKVISWQDNFSKTPFSAYRLDFRPLDSIDDPGMWYLEKWSTINGTNKNDRLISGYSSLFKSGWNHIEISVISNNIEIKVNDSVLTNIVDNNMIPYGGVGLGAIWESDAAFDNVEIIIK